MPLYSFVCSVPDCDREEEVICTFEQASASRAFPVSGVSPDCPIHTQPMVWKGVEAPRLDESGKGSSAGRFQMHAITESGKKVPGHFGIESKKHVKGTKT